MFSFFVEFKAAFDNINREDLFKIMRRKGIDNLVNRIEELYDGIENIVQVNGKKSLSLYTEKGVRQGCPLSPALFLLYLSDAEEMLEKW